MIKIEKGDSPAIEYYTMILVEQGYCVISKAETAYQLTI